MATSPLDSLCKLDAVRLIDTGTIESFLTGPEAAPPAPAGPPAPAAPVQILFFTGDPAQRPEAQDVAVVLRELLRQHGAALQIGVVARSAEAALQPVHGVVMLPTLVFLRGGRFAGLLPKIQDWQVYARCVTALLAGQPFPVTASAA